MITVGSYHAGVYCGERFLARPRSWRRYPLLRILKSTGFSIGPVLFWRDQQS